jgi:DNA-binding MarR family transcriptional regulator
MTERDLPYGVLFGRDFSTSVVLFQEALASKLGLNATDYRCLELIIRKDPMTAKALAEEVRLTTGAITGIVDHLEKAGYVERLENPKDRRSIIINPLITHQKIHEKLGNTMDSYRDAIAGLFKRYDSNQVAAIVDFLREFVIVLKEQTAKLQETSAKR